MVEFLFATCIGKKNVIANVSNDNTKIIMINMYNNPSCVATLNLLQLAQELRKRREGRGW